ncbi:hypothetical protein PG990_003149 [Apiospora arundinis]
MVRRPCAQLLLLLSTTISTVVSGAPLEQSTFDAGAALQNHGLHVDQYPDLAKLANTSSNQACDIACSALEHHFGTDSVDRPDEVAYTAFVGNYWSAIQSDVHPYCVFKPSTSAAVSVLVLLSRFTQCPFAVKSGGHAAFAGASNIEGGITVSFQNLTAVALSADKKVASVQPGNTWGSVYSTLQKDDVVVIGGRIENIGVGGLTTGGGISFFSSLYGLACDNVVAYDVVTAQGDIITANKTENPDLYWALRGGGNNFGIVVNFHLETMWGGSLLYQESSFDGVAKAFSATIDNISQKDHRAGLWLAMAATNGTRLASVEHYYAEPDGQDSAAWSAWKDVAPAAISDTRQNRILTEYTKELEVQNPNGRREMYYGLSVLASAEVLVAAKDIFYEEVGALENVPGILPVLSCQGFTLPILEKMKKNGGNPLGLEDAAAAGRAVYIVQIAAWWERPEDDTAVYSVTSKALSRIKAMSIERGAGSDYVYMNYASMFQDVIASYGDENKAKLKAIAAKYDPAGVFQTLQPGYFKLDRAPVPGSGHFSH